LGGKGGGSKLSDLKGKGRKKMKANQGKQKQKKNNVYPRKRLNVPRVKI